MIVRFYMKGKEVWAVRTFTLHDATGRRVLTADADSPTTREIGIDTAGLPTGVYLCLLEARGRRYSAPLVLTR